MKWTTKPDGHEYATLEGHYLRLRHVPTGWLVSRLHMSGWMFVAGDVRRETAIAKAVEVLG